MRSGGEKKTEHTASVPVDAVDEPWPDDSGVPEDISVVGAGAVVPNAPRSKQASPYPPGTVPGDSGIVPQLAEPPEDLPQPQFDDPWNGGVIQARPDMGIGGVRRIDPNDPFFQQDRPNPFDD